MGCVSSEPLEISALDVNDAKAKYQNEKVVISLAKVKDGKLWGDLHQETTLPSFQVARSSQQGGETPRPGSCPPRALPVANV